MLVQSGCEDKVLNGGGDVDEDEEQGDILSPASLDDLTEAEGELFQY